MGIVRTRVLGSACIGTLACSFDAGGLGSGSGDLEQSTGPSGAADSMASTDGAGEMGDAATADESVTNGDDPSTEGGDPTGAEGTDGGGCPEWWDEHWSRRRAVIIGDRELDTALLDFPVLVKLDATRIDYSMTQTTGTDLRFVLDAGQVLPHEIERWDPDGASFVWLRLPMINAMGMEQPRVFMYYGNPAAQDGQAGTNVWDAGFVSVHHLDGPMDSTANAHHGASGTPPTVVEATIGNGAAFDGYDDHLELPGESAYDFTTDLTVEAWIRVDQFDDYFEAIVTKGDDAWRLHRDRDVVPEVLVHQHRAAEVVVDAGVGVGTEADAAYGNAEKRIYVDGMPDGEPLAYPGPIKTTDSIVMIGMNAQQPGREYAGEMDEVRISNVARSRSWIRMQVASMTDQVLEYGPEHTCP